MRSSKEGRYPLRSLRPFFQLANLLGPDRELPEPKDFQPEGRDKGLVAELERNRQKLPEWRTVRVTSEAGRGVFLDQGFIGSIFPMTDPAEVVFYELFFGIRSTLELLANSAEKLNITEKGIKKRLQVVPVPRQFLTQEEDGAIGVESSGHDLFTEFIENLKGVHITRIRRCVSCCGLLFAWRIDRRACSEKCAVRVRVRNYREKMAQYEWNRRENRRRKATKTKPN